VVVEPQLTALCNDLMVEKVDDNIDSLNNENANPNISLTDNQVDLKHGDIKTDEETAAAPRRGVKRRSLTETGEMGRPLQAAQQQATSIFFETDL
jgi:hypothetical protein